MRVKAVLWITVISIIILVCTPVQAFNAWDIPGTYAVTSENPATFVIAFVKDHKTGSNMTVTMIRENSDGSVSESPPLAFYYDDVKGEAFHGQQIGNQLIEDWMYIKFDFSGYTMRGEGYMRWGEKGEEKIPFTMVKTDGETDKKWPSAGIIDVPRDEKGNRIDCGIRFNDISGEVQVRPGDDVLAWDMAQMDEPLYHGDVLRLQRGAEVHLALNDMSSFVLRGPAEIIVSLGPEKENKLLLLAGIVIRNVKKMVTDGTLEIEMSQGVAGIKGTTFVMEEDGTTSTLKVLEGTVFFKPNFGEEIVLTDGQMVSVTNGVAGKVMKFSINDALSAWSEETQVIFRRILAEAGQETEQKPGNVQVSKAQGRLSTMLTVMAAIAILFMAGVISVLIIFKRRKTKHPISVSDRTRQVNLDPYPRFCGQCGSQINVENAFCGRCGQRIR